MKIARYLSLLLLGFVLLETGSFASADPETDPTDDPTFARNPDGIPLSVTDPEQKQFTQAEIAAFRRQQAQAAANKDWLLRNYEQQLQNQAANNPSLTGGSNLFYQLSSNRDLAKLAGLTPLDTDSDSTTPFHAGTSDAERQRLMNLRAEASSESASASQPQHPAFFKPLITPLSFSNSVNLHNPYAPLPVAMPSPFSSGDSKPAPVTVTAVDQSQESTDIETPGMIAAEKDPLMDKSTSDLTLDILPGETVEQAKEHQDNRSNLELPAPMTADQLHKTEAAQLSGPNTPTIAKAPTPKPVAKPVPIDDSEAPIPANKLTPVSPVRAPIANPYDILNR